MTDKIRGFAAPRDRSFGATDSVCAQRFTESKSQVRILHGPPTSAPGFGLQTVVSRGSWFRAGASVQSSVQSIWSHRGTAWHALARRRATFARTKPCTAYLPARDRCDGVEQVRPHLGT